MHTHKSSREQHFPWQVLIVLNIYRLAVLLILLFIYLGFIFNDKNVFASSYLISGIGLIYLLFAVYCLFKSLKRKSHFNKMAILGIFIDILFFTFLIFMNQNLFILYGILMNIVIAAGSVIVAGRMSLLFAAWASICVLAIEVYISWVSAITLDVIQKTGFLCSTFFVIAIISFSLSKRIRESEQLAQKQEDDIAALERINALIVQNMEAGVLVIDDEDRIVVSNKSAWYLLGTAHRAGKPMLVDVSHRLMSCVQAWREGTQESVVIGQLLEVGLNPKFTALTDSDGQRKATLIIIEDAVELSKQAQQIKLASLGRLTASIAHEIRNPLSAISHAAQLMDERIIEPNDIRLMDIIKNNSRRVNDIIESMLQLSRRKASVPEQIHLRSWLSQFIHAFIGNYNVPALRDKEG